MKSLVRFVKEHGGYDHYISYPLRVLKGGFSESNTTCAWYDGGLVVNSRLVNYSKVVQSDKFKIFNNYINLSQTYVFYKNGLESRNIISRLNGTNEITNVQEVDYSKYVTANSYYKGFEDCRLVVWNEKLYAYGTRWDKIEGNGCICIYELDKRMQPIKEIVVHPLFGNKCEKNWGAVSDQPFTFVYNHNPLVVVKVKENGECETIKKDDVSGDIHDTIKGSTQVVRYDKDTYISLVHKNDFYEENGIKYTNYLTAFVFYDNDLNIKKISDWFVFKYPLCEFTCGIAVHEEDVYITYSQIDCTSQILVTNKKTIEEFMSSTEEYPAYDCWEFYSAAKLYENQRKYVSSSTLFNNAACIFKDNNALDDLKIECVIKSFLVLVKNADKFNAKELYSKMIGTLLEWVEKYPEYSEFYYLLCILYKISGDYQNYMKYKQLGDDRKENTHKYFFNYFNPNYL